MLQVQATLVSFWGNSSEDIWRKPGAPTEKDILNFYTTDVLALQIRAHVKGFPTYADRRNHFCKMFSIAENW